ncbi:MAG: hypothetical protein PHH28_00410 [Desulfuromonadaceae bacterium]|nr:hypothetical protein [Desulfuromonadaceae bacterium]
MSIDELVAAFEGISNDEFRQEVEARLEDAEVNFELESRSRIIDEAFLSRSYCL